MHFKHSAAHYLRSDKTVFSKADKWGEDGKWIIKKIICTAVHQPLSSALLLGGKRDIKGSPPSQLGERPHIRSICFIFLFINILHIWKIYFLIEIFLNDWQVRLFSCLGLSVLKMQSVERVQLNSNKTYLLQYMRWNYFIPFWILCIQKNKNYIKSTQQWSWKCCIHRQTWKGKAKIQQSEWKMGLFGCCSEKTWYQETEVSDTKDMQNCKTMFFFYKKGS